MSDAELLEENAKQLARELSIPREEARRMLESKRARVDGGREEEGV